MPEKLIPNPLIHSQKVRRLRSDTQLTQCRLPAPTLPPNLTARLFGISFETLSHPVVTSPPLPHWQDSRH